MRVWPGQPYPLGATWDGKGVNFAVFSEHATRVELCLFDSADDRTESIAVPLRERTDFVWHCYLPGLKPGQLYGYRVDGPHDPHQGQRFNPSKILLDPYAKSIGRMVRWDDSMFGYRIGDPGRDLTADGRDNAPYAPLAAVIDSRYRWRGDAPPRTPWHKTVIYELHVRGFTMRHPEVPRHLRGTYAGLAHKAAIKHLQQLGVTAVELMPVHHHVDDRHLVDRGLTNFWGYNTLSFFAPDLRYAADKTPDGCLREFKEMVRTFHRHGIEVILDVVYNHTGEGNELGPTLSLRGFDNANYYRLVPHNRRYYMDFTGCGNTLNMLCPRVLALIMDSLRYWVTEMHVDGFRFDLASALARELHDVDKLGAFFDIIHQDPILSQTKLIAEPWDLGAGGYQVGNFPVGWTEWNGKYRDCVRSFWKGDGHAVSEFATRLCGSSDLYAHTGRRPYASINFITAHDGFTMWDLVSYNHKHNEANGEGNRDGHEHNLSWNCGVEGPTTDPEVLSLRRRQIRNLFATLLLSQGVPMITSGDEFAFTRHGNNNAYCHDNDLNWINWDLDAEQKDLFDFCCRVVKLWRDQPVFQRRQFFQGRALRGKSQKDIYWLAPNGKEMSDSDWHSQTARSLGVLLEGRMTDEVDERGREITGDTMLLLLNARHRPVPFTLPGRADRRAIWKLELDTAISKPSQSRHAAGMTYRLEANSLCVLRLATRLWPFFPRKGGRDSEPIHGPHFMDKAPTSPSSSPQAASKPRPQ